MFAGGETPPLQFDYSNILMRTSLRGAFCFGTICFTHTEQELMGPNSLRILELCWYLYEIKIKEAALDREGGSLGYPRFHVEGAKRISIGINSSLPNIMLAVRMILEKGENAA